MLLWRVKDNVKDFSLSKREDWSRHLTEWARLLEKQILVGTSGIQFGRCMLDLQEEMFGSQVDRYTSLGLGGVSWLEIEIWELAA